LADDIYKKLSKLMIDLSGSVSYETKDENQSNFESSAFNDMLTSILLEGQFHESADPLYIICKPEQGIYHWFVNDKTKVLERITPGMEVLPIGSYDNDHMLCLVGMCEYKIPNHLVKCIGYN